MESARLVKIPSVHGLYSPSVHGLYSMSDTAEVLLNTCTQLFEALCLRHDLADFLDLTETIIFLWPLIVKKMSESQTGAGNLKTLKT